MPRYKQVKSLYKICLKKTASYIYSHCKNLEVKKIKNKTAILSQINTFLCLLIPASILDDIRDEHSRHQLGESLISYYFYKAVLHNNVKTFKAKNHQLKLTYWECLFKSSFEHLTVLNLALSSNDDILKLISIYCPNLEFLNATCRYERMRLGTSTNAASFILSVTDKGLNYLCQLKKLKVIAINEPRSQINGVRNSITYDGLRQLLLNIPTLQDISYTDLGNVISKDMQHIESLNLRALRHFNANIISIKEVFRLCKYLEEIHLTFFNNENRNCILNELLNTNLKLSTIGLVNLNFSNKFNEFFQKIGEHLIFLSVCNSNETITFDNLIALGKYCPNLKYLKYNSINNKNEIIKRPVNNIGQFSKLENLYISGYELNIEMFFILCTENAINLENLKLTEYCSTINVDRYFLNNLNTLKLQHIEVSPKLTFTKDAIRKMLLKFKELSYLNVYCGDDCKDLVNEIREENYDLTFINKVLIEEQWNH